MQQEVVNLTEPTKEVYEINDKSINLEQVDFDYVKKSNWNWK